MAAPHAVLAAFPRLLDALPRPGRWMELLKQSMGFILLLVALWLFSTLATQGYPFRVMGFAVVLAFSLWVWGSWPRHSTPPTAKWAIRLPALALAVAAGLWLLPKPAAGATALEPFDRQRMDQALAAGRPVLVKFTASWCLSCRIVDHYVYDRPEVARRLAGSGVLAMVADVTTSDTPGNALLYEQLEGAPPLTVIFRPDGPPIRLEGKFSPQDLLEALERASRQE
jgi:thiol:disulfide interchange protein DsbD